MQGSKMLKVTAILSIVFASVTLLNGLLSFLGLPAMLLTDYAAEFPYPELFNALYHSVLKCVMLVVALSMAFAVLRLIAGIVGVRGWNVPQRAGKCVGWGTAVVVCTVALNIAQAALIFSMLRSFVQLMQILVASNAGTALPTSADLTSFVLLICGFNLLVGLIVPVLYLIGACRSRRMAEYLLAAPYGYAPYAPVYPQPGYYTAPQPVPQPLQAAPQQPEAPAAPQNTAANQDAAPQE